MHLYTAPLSLWTCTLSCPCAYWNHSLGCRDGSGGKRACHQVQCPEFNPQNSHGGRRVPTPASCPLTSLHVLWQKCMPYIKCSNKYKTYKTPRIEVELPLSLTADCYSDFPLTSLNWIWTALTYKLPAAANST